jgi:membrane protease YdiL (CAAX protease family)
MVRMLAVVYIRTLMKIRTILQAVLFCLLSAMTLAFCSYLVKPLPSSWSSHLMLGCSIAITFIITLLFTRWSGLSLREIGAAPGRDTLKKFFVAFTIGLLLPVIQWGVVCAGGGYQVQWNDQVGLTGIFPFFLLYFLVAAREELTFRAFPLFSLNQRCGFLLAISLVTFIFILEHVAGGMFFWSAAIGPGLGGTLFAILAIKTKGIAYPMGVHAAWNFGQWAMGLKPEPGIILGTVAPGQEDWVNATGWTGYGIAMGIGVAAAILYNPKRQADSSALQGNEHA